MQSGECAWTRPLGDPLSPGLDVHLPEELRSGHVAPALAEKTPGQSPPHCSSAPKAAEEGTAFDLLEND